MNDSAFLQRCFDLAKLGRGFVSPNPTVGAVLVHQGRIIGEGFHRRYGGPHAEVEAVRSVTASDRPFINESTLYVSLEPCCIFGRTPPCTNLILAEGIPRVVVAQRDLTPEVSGRGLSILQAAGVSVTEIPSEPGLAVSLPRQFFVANKRPYIFLKFAQSADGFMAPAGDAPYWITHSISRRLVHRWRTQTGALLVGGRTVKRDNPQLTSRYFPGPHPLRVVVARSLETSKPKQVFTDGLPTLLFSPEPPVNAPGLEHIPLQPAQDWLELVLRELHQRRINHLTVEGGAEVLRRFIEANLWDEAVVFVGTNNYFRGGLPAPPLPASPTTTEKLLSDRLLVYHNPATIGPFSQSLTEN